MQVARLHTYCALSKSDMYCSPFEWWSLPKCHHLTCKDDDASAALALVRALKRRMHAIENQKALEPGPKQSPAR